MTCSVNAATVNIALILGSRPYHCAMSQRALPGRLALLVGGSALCLVSVACAPSDSSNDPGPGSDGTSSSPTSSNVDACAKPNTLTPGVLTVATDDPAFDPWFSHDDPSNGKGFESAVAYAVAAKMGFDRSAVTWTKEPFNASYQPGAKKFDFDINEISITAKRAQAVTFSDGYYSAAQAIITLKDSPYANATSLADFADATLGAQIGTTSLDAITDTIKAKNQPQVFDDTNLAKNALQNGQIDGVVVDLPTAFYITAVQLPKATIVGQFQPVSGEQEQFGLLFEKGNPLVSCANQALAALKSDGTLAAIEKQWLSDAVSAPRLDS
jgi:polar amino acid transport system substrate-binding protein